MTSSITGFTVFRLQSSSAFGTPRTEMLKAWSFFLRGPQRLRFFLVGNLSKAREKPSTGLLLPCHKYRCRGPRQDSRVVARGVEFFRTRSAKRSERMRGLRLPQGVWFPKEKAKLHSGTTLRVVGLSVDGFSFVVRRCSGCRFCFQLHQGSDDCI